MAAAFEDAGFDPVGAVSDFAVRDMFEELQAFGGGRGGDRGGAGPAGLDQRGQAARTYWQVLVKLIWRGLSLCNNAAVAEVVRMRL